MDEMIFLRICYLTKIWFFLADELGPNNESMAQNHIVATSIYGRASA